MEWNKRRLEQERSIFPHCVQAERKYSGPRLSRSPRKSTRSLKLPLPGKNFSPTKDRDSYVLKWLDNLPSPNRTPLMDIQVNTNQLEVNKIKDTTNQAAKRTPKRFVQAKDFENSLATVSPKKDTKLKLQSKLRPLQTHGNSSFDDARCKENISGKLSLKRRSTYRSNNTFTENKPLLIKERCIEDQTLGTSSTSNKSMQNASRHKQDLDDTDMEVISVSDNSEEPVKEPPVIDKDRLACLQVLHLHVMENFKDLESPLTHFEPPDNTNVAALRYSLTAHEQKLHALLNPPSAELPNTFVKENPVSDQTQQSLDQDKCKQNEQFRVPFYKKSRLGQCVPQIKDPKEVTFVKRNSNTISIKVKVADLEAEIHIM